MSVLVVIPFALSFHRCGLPMLGFAHGEEGEVEVHGGHAVGAILVAAPVLNSSREVDHHSTLLYGLVVGDAGVVGSDCDFGACCW